MKNFTREMIRERAGTNRIDAEGPWAGASWEGILNVGMYMFKIAQLDKQNKWYRIEEYNPKWKQIANDEIYKLRNHLSRFEWFKDIQHIGSTSIPNMAAKPIIDIILGVYIVDEIVLKEIKQELYFILNETLFFSKNEDYFFSLCVCEYESPRWKTRILFRNYFIDHPEEVQDYANLKKSIMKKYRTWSDYTKMKQEYISGIMVKQGLTEEEMFNGGVFIENPKYMGISMPSTKGGPVNFSINFKK